ncbi:MAG: MATE family efflux transporter [Candidatus Taylorbacteria bacterium RIFCSPHIGHO2_02_FULL_46_13]|uniref:Multidrug-efflux transporter n=1 Tax=Candidatus Taylorbacteria bacterium RIFCSPHIGHO2_02_FULL_46_13 TaxID=1802312 RepID=A0A1G2MQZ9_9BACT|nr:MAG: MATE family efflux transporter [Candidatus Taylorbacteria bacterium RIFCSPHIGHO2_02_FULL_46_13]
MDQNGDKLITHPIPSLIKEIAIPAIVGFFFNTMFNVVDTFYGGLLSTEALAALSLSFPVFFIIIAIGSGLSTGSTTLIANALGAGKPEEAKTLAVQSITLSILFSLALSFAGILISPLLFTLLGATAQYLSLSLDYMNVIFFGTVFFMLAYTLNAVLSAIGNTKIFRNFLVVGCLLNVLLDPWFMYGWFGFPALGLKGVALATIVIQVFGCVYMAFKIKHLGLLSGMNIKDYYPKLSVFSHIASQGVPAALNMFTVGIGIFVITYFISPFGKEAVAAYGIATRVEQIFLLPTIGLTIATLTLVGQNNGAHRKDRVEETWRTCIRYGMYIMTIGTLGIFFFASKFMELFTHDPLVISSGIVYLKIAAFITWAYALLFISVSALQGLKKPLYPLWIGLARQIVAPIIVFTLTARAFGIVGIWWGIFAITWAAAFITLFYLKNVLTHSPHRV